MHQKLLLLQAVQMLLDFTLYIKNKMHHSNTNHTEDFTRTCQQMALPVALMRGSWETGPWEKQSKQQVRPCDPWTCVCLPPQWWHHRSAAVSAGSSCYSGRCLHAQANGNSLHPLPCFYYRKQKEKNDKQKNLFLLFGIFHMNAHKTNICT